MSNKKFDAKKRAACSSQTKSESDQDLTPPKVSKPEEETKVFNDPIHGHIEMHPLCVKILDTSQFQRLRYIKQLGGCYFVYPGAAHNRFEHSIGVSHLAGELVRTLDRRQPELKINDKDILCVQIAGLCHDLGHGPFSHMFDRQFIPMVNPESQWKHEKASVHMFHHLIKSNNLKEVFIEYGLSEQDITFIAEQIEGPKENAKDTDWLYEGRTQEKGFLYEIVANKRNGIDVDKWDYFARDSYYLGIKINFDHLRFMKFARVIDVDGHKQICSRDKEAIDVYDMYAARAILHQRACQHKTNIIIERMICEAFEKANDFLQFEGKDGKPVCLADTIDDMVAFTRVNDCVYHQILNSTDDNLAPARKILERIENRDVYKCIGQIKPKSGSKFKETDKSKMREDFLKCMTESELGEKLSEDDVIIILVNFDYGMEDKNPIDYVRFYKKSDPNKAIHVEKDEVSAMLPDRFSDQIVRFYSKKTNKTSCEVAKNCFNKWCEKEDLKPPKGADMEIDMTHCKPSDNSQTSTCHDSQDGP